MNVLQVLKEEMAKSLKEIQENRNYWRKSINNSKTARKTQKSGGNNKIYKYSNENINQELKGKNYYRPRNRSKGANTN